MDRNNGEEEPKRRRSRAVIYICLAGSIIGLTVAVVLTVVLGRSPSSPDAAAEEPIDGAPGEEALSEVDLAADVAEAPPPLVVVVETEDPAENDINAMRGEAFPAESGIANVENVVLVEPAEEEVEWATGEDAVEIDPPVVEVRPSAITNAFTVLEQVGHDESSFTQGLSYGMDGTIYETTGLYGRSKVRRINPNTFDVELSVDTDGAYFGEGCAFYTDADGNGRLIHITWREQTGFIYDAETLRLLEMFVYTTTAPSHQGWGITYDASNQEFIVSDGSSYLYFWDRDTLVEKRKVTVTRFDGSVQNRLNELEYMDGLVCCNIWHTDEIICVDPDTGRSVREYDMSSLWPEDERGSFENVLNGIALGKDHVLLTGKRWDRMFKVLFPDWPTLFDSSQ